MPRHAALIVLLLCLTCPLAGCASRATMAERVAARMLDPAASARDEVRLRQRLIALAPESDPFLPDAFFPIGLYDVPESALPEIAAAGFNLILNGENAPSYLASAQALGLRVIPYVNLSNMRSDVRQAAGDRTIFAWYLFDEPDLNDLSAEDYARLAKELHGLDKSRPIFLTVLSPEEYPAYIGGCDIFASTIYPVHRDAPEKNNLRRVADAMDAARAVARSRPVWAILQAFHAEPIWMRSPTAREIRAMAFLALNHGASGILYFSYNSANRPITEHAELFGEIERLNGWLRALRGALLAPVMEVDFGAREVTTRSPAGDAPERKESALDCSLRRFLDAHILIAVNPDARQKLAQFSLPASLGGRRMEELVVETEARAGTSQSEKPGTATAAPQPLIVPSSGPLELDFEPYEVRLFRIR